jgi:hypothetical protein
MPTGLRNALLSYLDRQPYGDVAAFVRMLRELPTARASKDEPPPEPPEGTKPPEPPRRRKGKGKGKGKNATPPAPAGET